MKMRGFVNPLIIWLKRAVLVEHYQMGPRSNYSIRMRLLTCQQRLNHIPTVNKVVIDGDNKIVWKITKRPVILLMRLKILIYPTNLKVAPKHLFQRIWQICFPIGEIAFCQIEDNFIGKSRLTKNGPKRHPDGIHSRRIRCERHDDPTLTSNTRACMLHHTSKLVLLVCHP